MRFCVGMDVVTPLREMTMALLDRLKQELDRAGKVAQDAFDDGKTRLEAFRTRQLADKAAQAARSMRRRTTVSAPLSKHMTPKRRGWRRKSSSAVSSRRHRRPPQVLHLAEARRAVQITLVRRARRTLI